MADGATLWRRIMWTAGAAVTAVLFVFAATQALLAVQLQRQLHRQLEEPFLRLAVDLSRPGTYAAECNMPYDGYLGTEFKLVVTPPFNDVPALAQHLNGFSGAVSFSQPDRDAVRVPVAVSGFHETSQAIVRYTEAQGLYLLVHQLTGDGHGRLELTVVNPAPGLAGRDQVLEARPVLDPCPSVVTIYLAWVLAGVSFAIASAMSIILLRTRARWRRQASQKPS